MNESEKRFCEDRKKTFEHYGVKEKTGARYSVVQKQQNMLSLMGFLEGMVNPDKKTRLIIDYDPDFKEALLQVEESEKPYASSESGKIDDVDYTFNFEDEMTDKDMEEVPEEAKRLLRFFVEHNPEKKVIKICPANDNCISLHGAGDVENFIKAIRDYSREVFRP